MSNTTLMTTDTLKMHDVGNNSYSIRSGLTIRVFMRILNRDFELNQMHTYNVAKSKLDGHVGYAETNYGNGDCCGGG